MSQENIEQKTSLDLLSRPKVIQWCYEGITAVSLQNASSEKKLIQAKEEEKLWGNEMLGTTDLKQWTTVLCQEVVREALIKSGCKNVRTTTLKKSSLREKSYDPDLEDDVNVYEVKGRGWCTPGTAGEKILGVPLKYGELPRLYGKPLKIVLVGYQEYEARKAFAFGDLLNKNEQTQELKDTLQYFKEHKIEYVGLTDILTQIGLPAGCWEANS